MDASIRETCDSLEKFLKEGKMEEAKLVSQTLKLFPKNDVDRAINPVHPDIKKACLIRLTDSTDIRMIYNLAKISKLSKDEVREHVCRWIREESKFNHSKLSKEELEMVLELV